MKRWMAASVMVMVMAGCNGNPIDAKKLVGVWRLSEITKGGETKKAANLYDIYHFYEDGTLQILDSERVRYNVEGNKLIVAFPEGDKKVLNKIVSLDDQNLVIIDPDFPQEKKRYENITHFEKKILGSWKLKSIFSQGSLKPAQESRKIIFNSDRTCLEVNGKKTVGPNPYKIDGAFVEIDGGPEKTYVEIFSVNDTTLETNLLLYNPNLRHVYEREK